MSLGTPVICFSKTGGIAELIEEKGGGYCFPYGNLEAMVNFICDVVKNKIILNDKSNEAVAVSKQLNVDEAAPELLSLILSLDEKLRRRF